MTCYRRDLDNQGCCNAWQHGIRTIDGQYPDDNRDFKILEGAGIIITPVTAGIMITSTGGSGASLQEGQNIEITPSGGDVIIGTTNDIHVNGDLTVDGDIIQNGAAYETHAEKIYTTNDYIITRDGAVGALASGDYSGFQVEKYDGVNDGRLVIDNSGTARVGDVGGEQPLLTREEAAYMSNGKPLIWNANNLRAETVNSTIGKLISASNYSVDTTGWTTTTRLDGSKYSVKVITVPGATANGFPMVYFQGYRERAHGMCMTAANELYIRIEGDAPTSAFLIDYMIIEPL